MEILHNLSLPVLCLFLGFTTVIQTIRVQNFRRLADRNPKIIKVNFKRKYYPVIEEK